MSLKRNSESVLLDLSQFASIEDAMDKVEAFDTPEYSENSSRMAWA